MTTAVTAEPEGEVRMTFGEHLEELRSRLVKSITVLLITWVGLLLLYKPLAGFITQPFVWAMLELGITNPKLMPGTFGGPILTMMKLGFIVSLFVCSPWIGYQIWSFVSAGLYRKEKKYIRVFAPISFALFTSGCAFGFLILVPKALYSLASTMSLETISNDYTFKEYVNLVTLLTVFLGAVFQMPLVMVFAAKAGLVQPSSYNKWRRAAIIANVVVAAVVTPADIVTMLLVAAPMLVLYEVGVIFTYIFVRKKKTDGR